MQKISYSLFFIFSLFSLVSCGSNDNTDTPSPSTSSSSSASVDVLVLYDRDVKDAYNDVATRINHLFTVSNNAYRDSGLDITIHAKKILFYDAQTHPALAEIANSAQIQAAREEYKADTVLIYQVNPNGSFGQCGIAYGAGSYNTPSQFIGAMFAQVEINCPTETTVHEIGHNMGLRHSHLQDGDNAQPYSYGLGHGVNGKFATIMAYAYKFNTTNQIIKFSSPYYECITGYPCGIPIGQAGEAHATSVLEVTAPKIADLY